VNGSRRLSQAISEGDGISILVQVADAGGAATAEGQGAEGLALEARAHGVRDSTVLPILFRGESPEAAQAVGADAWVLVAEHLHDEGERLEELYALSNQLGLECVVDVHDDEELELVLARIDPEIFLLSPRETEDEEEALDRVLELLPDVPAGKLAIAELRSTTREEVDALERAGVDAVLVAAGNVADLVGGPQQEL
jgi:indole-3-glycerol phosphate synthase